ncbi:hypothetical protein D039_3402B, partial [Vibrio parahaemolyticus EKP-028]
TFR